MTRKKAKQFIESLLNLRSGATDELAVESMGIYPEWKPEKAYAVGARVLRGSILYKVREGQSHTSQVGWEPEKAPALWVAVNEEHEGTFEDPIPAVSGMLYEKDKYYVYNDIIYLCIREDAEGGTVLHFTPDQLTGNYFEIVE